MSQKNNIDWWEIIKTTYFIFVGIILTVMFFGALFFVMLLQKESQTESNQIKKAVNAVKQMKEIEGLVVNTETPDDTWYSVADIKTNKKTIMVKFTNQNIIEQLRKGNKAHVIISKRGFVKYNLNDKTSLQEYENDETIKKAKKEGISPQLIK